MNLRNLTEWKQTVNKLNSDAESIISLRDEAYSQLADDLKYFFNEHNLPIRDLHFVSDGSVIIVRFENDTSGSISFSRSFLVGISMPFEVRRKLNCEDGKVEHELFLELYPLEGDF